jgi:hypothetical protein
LIVVRVGSAGLRRDGVRISGVARVLSRRFENGAGQT